MTVERWFKLEKRIGNRATYALMEEEKEERYLNSFFGEAIAIVLRIPLN